MRSKDHEDHLVSVMKDFLDRRAHPAEAVKAAKSLRMLSYDVPVRENCSRFESDAADRGLDEDTRMDWLRNDVARIEEALERQRQVAGSSRPI